MTRIVVRQGFTLLGITALLLAGFAGCGGNEPAPVARPPAPPPAPPPFQAETVEVALGESGQNAGLMTTESGGFTLNGEAFASGGSVILQADDTVVAKGETAVAGREYLLTLGEDGMWTAAFQPMEVSVMSASDDSITVATLMTTEAGGFTHAGEEVPASVTLESGNMYSLAQGEDGMWTATFQPMEVSVMSATDETVAVATLVTTEAGGFTLDGADFEGGADMPVTLDDGRAYVLAQGEDGMWSAMFQPMPVSVVSATDETVAVATLMTTEAGGFTLDGADFEGGADMPVALDDGRAYVLARGDDGAWTAAFQPMEVPVSSATDASIIAATLMTTEAGGFTLDGENFASGSITTAANGNRYALAFGVDGSWTAIFQPVVATIPLGQSGDVATLTSAEAGGFTLDGADFASGDTTTAANGNEYTLALDADGMWAATFRPMETAVTLGSSGDTATLATTEAGGFTLDGADFASGDTTTAANGNEYALARGADGMWAAEFVPAAIAIDLGSSGDTATLMTTEAGGVTLDGADFASGGTTTAANGSEYALALGADGWAAEFRPAAIAITLGASGDTATLMTTEAGGFTLDGADFASGGTTTAANGNEYALAPGADGTWAAAFVPAPVEIPLGSSGDTATLMTTEAGGFTLDGQAFASGGMTTAENGNVYVLALGADGWAATYEPAAITVKLGDYGGNLPLMQREDGTFVSNGSDVEPGAEVRGDNGLLYALSFQDGQWSAEHQAVSQTVNLGASGQTVDLVQNEDSSWRISGDDEAFASGGTYRAANGNVYALSVDAVGTWRASFQPDRLPIAGTGYTAVAKEDRSGYRVDVDGTEVNLANDGFGDIGTFRVSSSGAGAGRQLTGMRFDSDIKTTALGGAGDDVASEINDGVTALALNADDDATTANEKNTRLTITLENEPSGKVAAVEVAVGDLFDDGKAAGSYDRFVAMALEEIQERLDSLERFIALIDLADDDEDTALKYTTDLNRLWKETNDQLRTVFGPNFELTGSALGEGVAGTRAVNAPVRRGSPDTVAMRTTLQDVVTALSSEDAFVDATRDNGDGVFEDRKLSEANATAAFNRETHEAEVRFGNTENTRFGAVWRRSFAHATDADPDDLQQGMFAYSPLQKTQNRQIVNAALPTGVASYRGQTVIMADESEKTPAFYTGDIEVGLRLTTNRVTGLVTNVLDENGAALRSFGYAVQSINLPQATLNYNATYIQAPGARATVRYQLEAGHPAPTVVAETTFTGSILGRSNDAATATIGQWTLDGAGLDLLGAFGAEQALAPELPRPTIDDDGAEAHSTSQMVGSLADGTAGAADARFALQIKDGNIRFLAKTTADDAPLDEAEIKVSAATLFNDADGRYLLKGAKFTTVARDNIQAQLDRFYRVIPLGGEDNSAGERATYVSERNDIWGDVDTELDRIFGPSRLDREDRGTLEAVRLGAEAPTSDDSFAEELESVIAALGSSGAFTDAFASRGVFERDAEPNYVTEACDACGPGSTAISAGRFVGMGGNVLRRYDINVVNAESVGAEALPTAATPLTSGGYVREYGKTQQHWIVTNANGEVVSGGSAVDTVTALGFRQRGTVSYTPDPVTDEPIRSEVFAATDTFRNAAGETLKIFSIDGVVYFGTGDVPTAAAVSQTRGDYHTDADGQILAASSARPSSARAYNLPSTPNVNEALQESFYLTRRSGAKGDVFNEVASEAIIEYRATDFTRFGFWRRQATDHADRKRAPSGSGNLGVSYAYSPLENTVYVAGDPNYPAGAQRMTYTGSTLAYDSARRKRYEGVVNLAVNWGELGANSTLVLEISGLQTRDLGEPILLRSDGTANDKQAIETIRFQETFIATAGQGLNFSGTLGAADNSLALDSLHLETARGEVEVLSSGATAADNEVNGASFLTGRFVGMNAEGPLGAMGRWSLSGIERWNPANLDQAFGAGGSFNNLNLIGAFGADLVQ